MLLLDTPGNPGGLARHKVRAEGVRLRNMHIQQAVRYRYIMGLLTLALSLPPGLSDDSQNATLLIVLSLSAVPSALNSKSFQ